MTINIYTNLEKDSALFQQLEKYLTVYNIRLVAAVNTYLLYAKRNNIELSAVFWVARSRKTKKNLQILKCVQSLATLDTLLKGKVKQNEKTTINHNTINV